MSGQIGLVVEGPGDAASVPVLLGKWLQTWGLPPNLLSRPISCAGRDRALRPNGLEGYVATAAARPRCTGVLVLLDSEGDPACPLGPQLLLRARAVTALPIVVALAETKYESWLRASAETLRLNGLNYGSQADAEDDIRRALGNRKYAKPTWQPRLTERMDLELACGRSQSLRRLREQFRVMAYAAAG